MFRRHDKSFRLLLAVPEAVRQLVIACRGAAFAARFRFDAMTELPTERTSSDFKHRVGDIRWLVPAADVGASALVVECQSTIDYTMEGRLVQYAGDALVGLRITGKWRRGVPSPEINTITVYNGDDKWEGLDSVSWAAPAGSGGGSVKITHSLLDMQRYADRRSPEDVLFHALSRAERYPDTFWDEVRRVRKRYRGPEWTVLRPRAGEWLWERGRVAKIPGIGETTPETIMEEGTVEAIEKRWKEYEDRLRAKFSAEAAARGRAEGVARGEVGLVGRLAARKFGREAADRIAAACGPGNGKRLEEVADAIYECDSAADLLARIERMA